jgi:hypothetical protein
MDLFDELFDGGKSNASSHPTHRPPALDEALDSGEEDSIGLQPLNTSRRGAKKRSRENDGVERQKKKVKKDGQSAPVIAFDDSEELEILTTKSRTKSEADLEDAELHELLRNAHKIVDGTVPTLGPTIAQQNALAALHRTRERATAMGARLRETAAKVELDDSHTVQPIHGNSGASRPLHIGVKDATSARRVILPVHSHWTGAQLRPLASRALELDEQRCTLSYLGITLDDTRTLDQLSLQNGDEILARVTQPSTKASNEDLDAALARRVQELTQQTSGGGDDEGGAAEDANAIRLKIRVNKQDVTVALKKSDHFGKVITALRTRFKVPEDGKVRLTIDGEAIAADDTPEDHDLEDGEQLDAFITLPEEQQQQQTRNRR